VLVTQTNFAAKKQISQRLS